MANIKQPNSRMCFICGVENPVGLHLHIFETQPGQVEADYVAPAHFQGYPGVLHGRHHWRYHRRVRPAGLNMDLTLSASLYVYRQIGS